MSIPQVGQPYVGPPRIPTRPVPTPASVRDPAERRDDDPLTDPDPITRLLARRLEEE